MPRIYLRTAKLPALTEEDRRPYDMVLRQLRATIDILDNKNSSPRDRMRPISRLLASVELVHPDIQALWRKEFIELLDAFREMRKKYGAQNVKS